jgi:hypothetical protein
MLDDERTLIFFGLGVCGAFIIFMVLLVGCCQRAHHDHLFSKICKTERFFEPTLARLHAAHLDAITAPLELQMAELTRLSRNPRAEPTAGHSGLHAYMPSYFRQRRINRMREAYHRSMEAMTTLAVQLEYQVGRETTRGRDKVWGNWCCWQRQQLVFAVRYLACLSLVVLMLFFVWVPRVQAKESDEGLKDTGLGTALGDKPASRGERTKLRTAAMLERKTQRNNQRDHDLDDNYDGQVQEAGHSKLLI